MCQRTQNLDELLKLLADDDPRTRKYAFDRILQLLGDENKIKEDYNTLNSSIIARSNDTWLFGALLVPTSLLILMYTAINPVCSQNLILLSIASILSFSVWLIIYHRTSILNGASFKLLKEIEEKKGYITHRFMGRVKERHIITKLEGTTLLWIFFSILLGLWFFLIINRILPLICSSIVSGIVTAAAIVVFLVINA